MVRSEREGLGSLGRRLLAALAVVAPGVIGAGCSQEPVALTVPPSSGGGTQLDPSDPRVERCGADGIECGDVGCCTAGNTCSEFGRCIPDIECESTEDCSSDSQCAAGRCIPWDVLPEGRRFNASCRTAVDLPSVIPEIQCQWPGANPPAVFPNQVQVIGTPMVVDFNSDGDPSTIHPSIVFISYEGNFAENTGAIRVIDGETCELQDTIEGQFPFTPEVPLAIGDINNDGRPDIVAADEQQVGAAIRSGVAVFELSGSGPVPQFREMPRGRVLSSSTGIITGFALHDVTNDDYPEIFTEKTMLGFSTEFESLVDLSPVQPPNRPELSMIEPPTVIDVDGDQLAEVITSQGVFSWDTLNNVFVDKSRGGQAPLWNPDELIDAQGAFMAAANLADWATGLPQGKDSAELVVVGHNGNLWVRQVDGQTRFRMQTRGLAGGPPVIADFDGDGRMEFGSGGIDRLTVFDLDCTPAFFNQPGCGGGRGSERADGVVWESRTQGAQSGLAVFDFDGNGRTELVYADQCFMRVYDGRTGDVLFSTPRSSTTRWEYPVVADTDGDGKTEIVTASNDNDNTLNCPSVDAQNQNAQVEFRATHGITVWKERDDRWAGSRPIWNQHNYFVTNVRDDGTIPPMGQVQAHWGAGGPNTFRQNVQGETGQSLSLADITTAGVATFECKPEQNLATLQVDLCNRGSNPLRENEAEVVLINPSTPRDVLCRVGNTRALGAGQCVTLPCDIPVTPLAEPFDVMIMGDAQAQVDECFEANNRSLISRVSCDPAIQ